MTNEGEAAVTSTTAKPSSFSCLYLMAILAMVVGTTLPRTWPAHQILLSCGMALLAVTYRRSPYLLSTALFAVFFSLVEFRLIGKPLGLVVLSLIVLLALFTWRREKRRKQEQHQAQALGAGTRG